MKNYENDCNLKGMGWTEEGEQKEGKSVNKKMDVDVDKNDMMCI